MSHLLGNKFLNKQGDIQKDKHHLPHWHQDGKIQFVTFRLADSLPKDKWETLQAGKANFLQLYPEPWNDEVAHLYYQTFGSKIDEWIDAGYGSCLLRNENVRKIVEDTLFFYDGEKYLLHTFVIMPNHVHIMFELLGENTTRNILHSWKSFSSSAINKAIGRAGTLWQKESFDRIIRDATHYTRVLHYIANNPNHCKKGEYTLFQGGVQGSATSLSRQDEVPVAEGAAGCRTSLLYDDSGKPTQVNNINAYLLNAANVFIENRKKPLCDVPEMVKGSSPVDGGNFLMTSAERDEILQKDPACAPYIHQFLGAEEFLHSKPRYCFWLDGISPREINEHPIIKERVANVRQFRLASTKEATRKYADYPTRFMEMRQPKTDYLLFPRVSSEKRRYVPIGYISADTIVSDSAQYIPNASLFHFGVLMSNVHNAWMRAVCGRLEMRYRYSNAIVYNNFPWPQGGAASLPRQDEVPVAESATRMSHLLERIEQTAQAILDARAKYPDCSLAELYDEGIMPIELRKAHRENDIAVMQAYGFDLNMTESECVARLMEMYKEMTK